MQLNTWYLEVSGCDATDPFGVFPQRLGAVAITFRGDAIPDDRYTVTLYAANGEGLDEVHAATFEAALFRGATMVPQLLGQGGLPTVPGMTGGAA